jgi:hypothetical protein
LLSRRTVVHRSLAEIRYLLPVLVLGLSLAAWAQDDSTSGQAPAPDAGNGAPPPAATGAPGQNLENPPLSGLDRPRSEPAFGGRSYFVPGVQVSEGVVSNTLGPANGGLDTVTRVLGSADLQKLWRNYQVGLDYIGGVAGNIGPLPPDLGRVNQVDALSLDQRVPWRTGQLSVRDSFTYLPEGSFGFNSFGGAASIGAPLGVGMEGTGLGGGIAGGAPAGIYLGGGQFGGNQRHIENLSTVDVVQAFSPRSTVTLAGGYDFVKFYPKSNNPTLINSQQTSGQVGYNRILTRSDQIGVLYAFQELHFPNRSSGTIEVHVWNVLYGRRLTGKLNLTAGGGPEILQVRTPPFTFLLLGIIPITIPGSTQRSLSGSGHVTFSYILSARTSVNLGVSRYVSTGSGFLAGANTDAARLSLSHTFARRWGSDIDGGYSYNSRLQNLSAGSVTSARRYQYWYLGGLLNRQLGRHFEVFANYQFSNSGIPICSTGSVCGSHEQIGSVGLNWRPNPIHLD